EVVPPRAGEAGGAAWLSAFPDAKGVVSFGNDWRVVVIPAFSSALGSMGLLTVIAKAGGESGFGGMRVDVAVAVELAGFFSSDFTGADAVGFRLILMSELIGGLSVGLVGGVPFVPPPA